MSTVSNWGATVYGYDKLDLVAVQDRLGFTNRFVFDAVRRKIAETNALGRTNIFAWCTCGALDSTTDALGQKTTYLYNSAGWPTNISYPDGSSAAMEYDLLGRITRQRDPAGNWTTNAYNNQGLLVSVNGPVGQLLARTYDYRDRLTNSVDVNGVTTVMTYDDLDRVLSRKYPDGGMEGFLYNSSGLVAYTNQLLNVSYYTNDAAGRKVAEVNANGEWTQFGYAPSGSLSNLVDGNGHRTSWQYDQYGKVTTKLDHLGTNAFSYSYDANDRLTNRTSAAKGKTGYTFDAVGNLTNIDYAVSPDIRMSYDALNRLTNMVDAVGTNAFSYTSFGALASEDGPWASDTITYSYTSQLRTGLSLAQASGGSWTNAYSYDGANRLLSLTAPMGAFNYTFQGAGGVVQNLSLPNGSYITNVHDSVMRLTSTTLSSSSNQVLNSHSYSYNPLNQRTNTVRVDGSYAQYAYDLAGQLIKASGFESNGTARLHEKFAYAYDSAENLSYRTNNALVQTFTVNALNGLTNVTRNATNALTVAGTTTIGATNVTVNGSTANLYADNTFAREGFTPLDGNNAFTAIAQDAYGGSDSNSIVVNLPLSTTFQYDLNGNMTNDGTHVLDYDDENQLVTNTVAGSWKSEFVYDGRMRRRIRREYSWQGGAWVKTNEVRYVYDGNLVLQERDSSNSGTMTYTRGLDMSGSFQAAGGIGGLLALSQPATVNSQPAYYHADGNGNVTALVNQRQEVVARYLYDPFGDTLSAAGPMAELNLYRFSSKETHANSGLVYYVYRFYDPKLERWPNRDPLAEVGFEVLSRIRSGRRSRLIEMNLYVFVDNRPLTAVDSLGLDYVYWPPSIDGGNCSAAEIKDCQKACFDRGLVLKRCHADTWTTYNEVFYNGVVVHWHETHWRQPYCDCGNPRSCPPPIGGAGKGTNKPRWDY